MKEIKVAPKPNVKRMMKRKPSVEMVTYSIKMTIPTGPYANIIPEIVVRGGSIEEAHNFVVPHMNKMWKEYYLVNERRPEPAPVPPFLGGCNLAPLPNVSTTIKVPIKTVTKEEYESLSEPMVEAPPASSVALIKATKAIESCLSIDALDIIANQVNVSVKLTDEDKATLMPLIDAKYTELGRS